MHWDTPVEVVDWGLWALMAAWRGGEGEGLAQDEGGDPSASRASLPLSSTPTPSQ